MNAAPLISVIVPVYNVAPYLPRCLDSICNQTYTNLEIILVDDGSTDDSLSICQKYATQDKRVVVLRQKNEGPSAARNCGMDHMHGDFFTFADGDDWLPAQALQTLVGLQQQTKARVTWGSYTKVENYRQPVSSSPAWPPETLKNLSGEDGLCLSVSRGENACWGKLFCRESAGSLRFNRNYCCGEDLDFLFQIFRRNIPLAYTPKSVYFYFQRPGSIMHTRHFKQQYKVALLFQQIYDFCQKNRWLRAAPLVQQEVVALFSTGIANLLLFGSRRDAALWQELSTWSRKHRREIITSPKMGIAGKSFMLAFSYFPRLVTGLCRTPGLKIILRRQAAKRLA